MSGMGGVTYSATLINAKTFTTECLDRPVVFTWFQYYRWGEYAWQTPWYYPNSFRLDDGSMVWMHSVPFVKYMTTWNQ